MFKYFRGFTDSMGAFYIYIDVSKDFVGSGSEDNLGRVWDRYSGHGVGRGVGRRVCLHFNMMYRIAPVACFSFCLSVFPVYLSICLFLCPEFYMSIFPFYFQLQVCLFEVVNFSGGREGEGVQAAFSKILPAFIYFTF